MIFTTVSFNHQFRMAHWKVEVPHIHKRLRTQLVCQKVSWFEYFQPSSRQIQILQQPKYAYNYVIDLSEEQESIFNTIRSLLISTFPNTTCLPSNQEVLTVVTKNWQPLEFGPELAMPIL